MACNNSNNFYAVGMLITEIIAVAIYDSNVKQTAKEATNLHSFIIPPFLLKKNRWSPLCKTPPVLKQYTTCSYSISTLRIWVKGSCLPLCTLYCNYKRWYRSPSGGPTLTPEHGENIRAPGFSSFALLYGCCKKQKASRNRARRGLNFLVTHPRLERGTPWLTV